jgi:hypothetical protein
VKLLLSRSATRDLVWFRHYYESVFPAGERAAKDSFDNAKAILRRHPFVGHPLEQVGVRELVVPRTPFSIIYTCTSDRIDFIRIFDQRAERPKRWT